MILCSEKTEMLSLNVSQAHKKHSAGVGAALLPVPTVFGSGGFSPLTHFSGFALMAT